MKKAIVLVSGGLDSATTLAYAQSKGFECYALLFDYGQRHRSEINAAMNVLKHQAVKQYKQIIIDLMVFGGSALTDHNINVPEMPTTGIPVTYVPARNTIFLTYALAWAEVIPCFDIFIGVNAVDYSGYPDCRPDYIKAFQNMANLATKRAVEGGVMTIHTPLIDKTKDQIITMGMILGVDYGMTVSCYNANENGQACGVCESCRLRRVGFEKAGIEDPTPYFIHV